jgi:hypothetical protein
MCIKAGEDSFCKDGALRRASARQRPQELWQGPQQEARELRQQHISHLRMSKSGGIRERGGVGGGGGRDWGLQPLGMRPARSAARMFFGCFWPASEARAKGRHKGLARGRSGCQYIYFYARPASPAKLRLKGALQSQLHNEYKNQQQVQCQTVKLQPYLPASAQQCCLQ